MKKKSPKDTNGLTRELRAQGWMTFDEMHAEHMRDPEYKALWEADEPVRKALFAEIDARIEQETTRKNARRAGSLTLGFSS